MFLPATRIAIGATLIAALLSGAPCLGQKNEPDIVDGIVPWRLDPGKVTLVKACGNGLPEVSAVEVTPPEGVTVTILPLSRLPKPLPGEMPWPCGAFEFSVDPEAVLGKRQVFFVTPYGTRFATVVLFRPDHTLAISDLAVVVAERKKPAKFLFRVTVHDERLDFGERPRILTSLQCKGTNEVFEVDAVITERTDATLVLTAGSLFQRAPRNPCRLGVSIEDAAGNQSNWLHSYFEFQ